MLNPTYQAILERRILGKKTGQIAQELELPPTRVRNIMRKPSFQNAMALANTERSSALVEAGLAQEIDARAVMKRAAVKAAKRLEILVDEAESEKVQLGASIAILDRELPKQRDGDNAKPSFVMPAEAFNALMEALAEAKSMMAPKRPKKIKATVKDANGQTDSHSGESGLPAPAFIDQANEPPRSAAAADDPEGAGDHRADNGEPDPADDSGHEEVSDAGMAAYRLMQP